MKYVNIFKFTLRKVFKKFHIFAHVVCPLYKHIHQKNFNSKISVNKKTGLPVPKPFKKALSYGIRVFMF